MTPSKSKFLKKLLIIATLASSAYAAKKHIDNNSIKKELQGVILEKEAIQKELASITNNYENVTHKNKKLSKRVINEINKIISLKGSVNELDNNIKADKEALADKTNLTQNLASKNERLSNEINKAKALNLSSFETTTMRKKLNGKYTQTTNIKKIDAFKISFKIQENSLASTGKKTIHLQLINSKEEIIAVKKQVQFRSKVLKCSDEVIIDYNEESIVVTSLIKTNRDVLKSGNYQIKAFIDGEFIKKSSFIVN